MGALSCFFPIAISVASGLRQVDGVLIRVGRSFGATPLQMLTRIYLPAMRRPIVNGARLGPESRVAVTSGDALVFGKESVGLSEELLARFPDRTVGIPTLGAVRSLNLANAVGIALYEALRQVGALSRTFQG